MSRRFRPRPGCWSILFFRLEDRLGDANWPQAEGGGDRLAVGTIESWLIWKLTGGLHITDATNASRTALMAIGSGQWDDGLIDLFGAPHAALLPAIVDCAGQFGETTLFGAAIPICGIAGDQQAATIGQILA